MSKPLIEVKDLKVYFKQKSPKLLSFKPGILKAVDQVSFSIEKGKTFGLVGESGCGKSTLLRCLSGLETVTSGKVYLDDRDITDVNPKDRDIGMVFQQYSLFPNMDVAQNVAFGLKMKKVPNAEIDKRVKEMVDIVHEYGKEAMMFMGDHWIGMEPFMDEFASIGLDAVVGSVGNGATLRLFSDIKNVKYTEGRFLPYFFPGYLPRGR